MAWPAIDWDPVTMVGDFPHATLSALHKGMWEKANAIGPTSGNSGPDTYDEIGNASFAAAAIQNNFNTAYPWYIDDISGDFETKTFDDINRWTIDSLETAIGRARPVNPRGFSGGVSADWINWMYQACNLFRWSPNSGMTTIVAEDQERWAEEDSEAAAQAAWAAEPWAAGFHADLEETITRRPDTSTWQILSSRTLWHASLTNETLLPYDCDVDFYLEAQESASFLDQSWTHTTEGKLRLFESRALNAGDPTAQDFGYFTHPTTPPSFGDVGGWYGVEFLPSAQETAIIKWDFVYLD